MKKNRLKLALNRETLRHLVETRSISPNDSCIQSCYLVSCDGGCGISDGAAEEAFTRP
jgi:hypothetical protein